MERRFFEVTTQRNQRWVSYQAEQWRKQKLAPTLKKEIAPPFITISREFGCSGFSLGEMLAYELNKSVQDMVVPWAVYDKLLLEKIENEHGIHQVLLKSLTEKTRNEISDFFSSYIAAQPTQLSVYKKMFMAIRALAHRGYSIIIGRGAAVVTRRLENGFHIRIFAPSDWKIQQIMKIRNLSSGKEAKALLEKANREREVFVKKYLKVSVNDPSLYHLMINHAYFTREEIIDIIIEALKKKGVLNYMV